MRIPLKLAPWRQDIALTPASTPTPTTNARNSSWQILMSSDTGGTQPPAASTEKPQTLKPIASFGSSVISTFLTRCLLTKVDIS